MSGIATLGFATRTGAVHALREAGFSTQMIAEHLGIKPNNVTALEASAARSRPRTASHVISSHAMTLTTDVLRALRPHAARRGMHVTQLARLIVETVVDEGIVDAVLDDQS